MVNALNSGVSGKFCSVCYLKALVSTQEYKWELTNCQRRLTKIAVSNMKKYPSRGVAILLSRLTILFSRFMC